MANKFLFDQNCVYHSYLRSQSPVVLKLSKSGVQQSKYRDDQHFIYIDAFRGYDDEGRYYSIENDRCRKKIETAPKGQWIKLSAIGHDTEEADLVIEGVKGSNTDFDEFVPDSGSYSRGTVLDDYLECINTVLEHVPGATDEDGQLTDAGQKHAATLMINWERTDYQIPLHEGMVEESRPEPQDDPDSSPEERTQDSDSDLHPELRQVLTEFRDGLNWEGESHSAHDLSTIKTRVDAVLEEGASDKEARDIIRWCRLEQEHQNKQEEEGPAGLPEDDLPF